MERETQGSRGGRRAAVFRRSARPPREVAELHIPDCSSASATNHRLPAFTQLKNLAGTEAPVSMKEHVNIDDVTITSSKANVVEKDPEGLVQEEGPVQEEGLVQEEGSDEKGRPVQEEGSDEDDGPIIAVISKRIRNRKKKLREIGVLEKKVKNGNAISCEQEAKVRCKGGLTVVVEELESMKTLLRKAIAEELSSKIKENSAAPANTTESSQVLVHGGLKDDKNSAKKDSVSVEDVLGIKDDEISAKTDPIADENGPARVDASATERMKIDESSAKNDLVPHENEPAQSAKNAEAVAQNVAVAQVELDENIVERCYSFLKRYRLEGDVMPSYHGDALALVSRRSMRILYSDIYSFDKRLAMQICADYERLKPSITQASKRFAREALKNTIKGLTPQKTNAVNDSVENLNLILVAMPKSHQMLNNILQPRSIVMEDVEVHSDPENPMKTPSNVGAALLLGILQDLISKHLQGLSFSGQFGIESVEVYNGERYVINSPVVRYTLGSKEWAEACKKDFNSFSGSFTPLFKTGKTYTPYMEEFKKSLLTVPLDVLQSKAECLTFHEFMLNHLAAKPIPVRAALFCGIHNCCKSFDLKDPAAPFKDILHNLEVELPEFGSWTNSVKESGNELLIMLLTKKVKKGKEIKVRFENDFESMDTYLRVLYEHGSDYTKNKNQSNGGNMRNNSNLNWNNSQNQTRSLNRMHNQNMHQRNNSNLSQNGSQNMNLNMMQDQRTYRRNNSNLYYNASQNQSRNLKRMQGQSMAGRNNPNLNQNAGQNQSRVQNVNLNRMPNQNTRNNCNLYSNASENQSMNQNQNLNLNCSQNQNLDAASSSQQLNELDEPQVQRLKLLNELEMCAARPLGPYVCEMIYTLLKKNAMTGMLLPIWEAFKSCKTSVQGH